MVSSAMQLQQWKPSLKTGFKGGLWCGYNGFRTVEVGLKPCFHGVHVTKG